MEIYYKNSSGKIIYLDREPYKMLASTNLFDYAWDYSSQGSSSPRITQVQKKHGVKGYQCNCYRKYKRRLSKKFRSLAGGN